MSSNTLAKKTGIALVSIGVPIFLTSFVAFAQESNLVSDLKKYIKDNKEFYTINSDGSSLSNDVYIKGFLNIDDSNNEKVIKLKQLTDDVNKIIEDKKVFNKVDINIFSKLFSSLSLAMPITSIVIGSILINSENKKLKNKV
jgi:hypothetical protein